MKRAIKYIEKEILALARKYRNTFYAAYEFDVSTDTFFVEVLPEDKFNESRLKEDLADVIFDFETSYPDYSICFISNDRLFNLTNPTVIVELEKFDSVNVVWDTWMENIDVNQTYHYNAERINIITAFEGDFSNRLKFKFESDSIFQGEYFNVGMESFNIDMFGDAICVDSEIHPEEKNDKSLSQAA